MEEPSYSGAAFSDCALSIEFAPVEADELGFAMSFFVAAVNGRFGTPDQHSARMSQHEVAECGSVLGALLLDAGPVASNKLRSQQASLGAAFATLWGYYKDHNLRQSLCARVLCFHLLMERTEGRAVAGWTSPCIEDPEQVLLHPAVVDALACVPLVLAEGLTQAQLTSAIEQAYAVRSLTE